MASWPRLGPLYRLFVLLGTPTLAVQALDLGLVAPLSLGTAVLMWRRRPAGHLLAALFSVKAVTMAGAILAMLISAWMVERRLEVVPFAIFVAVTVFAGWLAVRVLRSAALRDASLVPREALQGA